MYQFSPSIAVEEKNRVYVAHDDIFTENEFEFIEKYCARLMPTPAKIYDQTQGQVINEVRRCTTSVINYIPALDFFFERIAKCVRVLNAKNYNFDIDGFFEPLQYLQYEASIEGHYDSHIDSGTLNIPQRKLSIVIQMSDPSEYDGGDLQLFTQSEPVTIPKKKGRIVLFPSYTLHRVTPVTRGLRKTIVGWIAGPPFK